MERTKNSSQEESSSKRPPRVRCLSWVLFCWLMLLLLSMLLRKLRWDANTVVLLAVEVAMVCVKEVVEEAVMEAATAIVNIVAQVAAKAHALAVATQVVLGQIINGCSIN